jgi:hypothetical protein
MDSAPSHEPITTYSTHPLHLGISANIRLIEVLAAGSADDSSPVSCKLHVVPLDDNPVYIALSYVWGNASVTKTILLDGEPFVVRENLWNFLNHWKATTADTKHVNSCLWIDAISIDQGSIQERNHQVAIMGRIYSEAEMVIAWLGTGPPALADALDVLEGLFNYMRGFGRGLSGADYETFDLLQKNEYWTRVWIIQECVLAKRFELWCGSSKMTSAALVTAIHGFESTLGSNTRPHTTDLILYNIMKLRGEFDNLRRPQFSLPTLCEMFPHMQCTDVRDRVYALLSLVSPHELKRFPIHADYSRSASELFWVLFRRACFHEGVSSTSVLDWTTRDVLSKTMSDFVEMLEIDGSDENYALAVDFMLARHRPISELGRRLQDRSLREDQRGS